MVLRDNCIAHRFPARTGVADWFASGRGFILCALLQASLTACSDTTGSPAESDNELVSAPLVASLPQVSVFMDPVVAVTEMDGRWVATVNGSISRRLSSVSFGRDYGATAKAWLRGPKSFALRFEGASLDKVLAGEPCDLQLETTTSPVARYFVRFEVSARYRKFTGSKKIFVASPIVPVYAGPHDARLSFRSEFANLTTTPTDEAAVYSSSGGGLAPTRRSEFKWSFDRNSASLLGELDQPVDRTFFELRVIGETLQKKARAVLEVGALSLSLIDPNVDMAPESCNDAVGACLETQVSAGDVSACGDFRAVTRCLETPRSCLFGWTLDQALGDADFAGESYQRIEGADGLPAETAMQIVDAARQVDPSVATVDDALALGGGFIERHQFRRRATGVAYASVHLNIAARRQGAIFEQQSGAVVSVIKDSFLSDCTLLAAEGGGQVGDDCAATDLPCGAGLSCFGQSELLGIGKCVPEVSPDGIGESCEPGLTECPSEQLVCGGAGTGVSGNCVPTWFRGQFGASQVLPLDTGSEEWPIEVYGLATVATDVGVYAEVVNVVPSKVIVKLRNPAGTVSTLWDGPVIAGSEPWIDGDNFIELAQDAEGFPGDESANGTWALIVESLEGNSPGGELNGWSLTVTSRLD